MLGSSGLEILEFDGIDNMRLIARKIVDEFGPSYAATTQAAPLPTAPHSIIVTHWYFDDLNLSGFAI
jgi:hypothetical protein